MDTGRRRDDYDFRGMMDSVSPHGLRADFERLSAVLQGNPDDVSALVERGRVRSDLGDDRRAVDDYDRAIDLDPDNAAAHRWRGYSLCPAGGAPLRRGGL